MKFAFDTNVLIDAIAEQNNYEPCQRLMILAADGKADGVITANTITDIHYILRKRLGETRTRHTLWELMNIYEVAPVTAKECLSALSFPMKDYEDSVLTMSAMHVGAEYIATSDRKFLGTEVEGIQIVSPEELVQILQ